MTNRDRRSQRRRMARFGLTAALASVVFAAAGGIDVACAQSDATQRPVRSSEIDHSTNEWLALQRGNTEAAPARPMLGAEAGLAYRRYLESFNSRIPVFFDSSVGQASGSGSPGGTLPQN